MAYPGALGDMTWRKWAQRPNGPSAQTVPGPKRTLGPNRPGLEKCVLDFVRLCRSAWITKKLTETQTHSTLPIMTDTYPPTLEAVERVGRPLCNQYTYTKLQQNTKLHQYTNSPNIAKWYQILPQSHFFGTKNSLSVAT